MKLRVPDRRQFPKATYSTLMAKNKSHLNSRSKWSFCVWRGSTKNWKCQRLPSHPGTMMEYKTKPSSKPVKKENPRPRKAISYAIHDQELKIEASKWVQRKAANYEEGGSNKNLGGVLRCWMLHSEFLQKKFLGKPKTKNNKEQSIY